ncbi:MAG: PD40 domain-containing protein [Acidobacteriota bacterium]|nr:PD40 domain-containing protein [Acidobacteriota bacterium]
MTRISLRSARLLLALAALLVPFTLVSAGWAKSTSEQHLLLRNPSLSAHSVAFLYADDVWTVSREGGAAQRLTSNGHVVAGPFYSPDGSQIAYSAHLNGNTDVYVIPSNGGIPHRITWHPMSSTVAGWTPDGRNVLIASGRTSFNTFLKLFLVRADGTGMPEPLPLPAGEQGSFSPDGKSIAYEPVTRIEPAWKQYHGGNFMHLWIVNLKTLDLVKIPRDNSVDFNPVWVGNDVYFLSNRNGPVSLFKYDIASKIITQVEPNHSYDLKTFQAGPGGLVYEQFGSIHLVDLPSGADHSLHVEIHGDLPELEPHLATVHPDEIQNAAISPTGQRAVFEAHGEIFTVPAEKGDTRNLTQTSGAAERDPSWSPDGKMIAYFSDASGEYQLYLRDQTGFKAPTVIDLGPNPSFFYSPTWSPDSKHIAYADKHLHLWVIDVPTATEPHPKPVLVDSGIYGSFGSGFSQAWSPDSKWIAYDRDLDNHLHAIFLYSLDTHKFTQITDGMSDATNPVFDADGKYLYFIASTNDGPSQAGIDLSSLDRAQSSSPYVVVLAKDGASPIPPESDDEKVKDEKSSDTAKSDDDKKTDKDKKDTTKADADKKDDKEKKDAKTVKVTIDLDGIGNRILALPIPAHNYLGIEGGKDGVLYLLEGSPYGRPSEEDGPAIHAVWRFTLKKRKPEQVLEDLDAFAVSADGSKVLYGQHHSWAIAPSDDLKPGNGHPGKSLNLAGMQTTIDPRAEWKQMFDETWRIERDIFYDPNLHGLSLSKVESRYRPYLAGLASRDEFTYLCIEMLGEINVGHMFVGGPRIPDHAPKTGLLGANYTVENGRYRIAKILGGENWTPGLESPLTMPGVYVKNGEYILAVNGRDLKGTDNIYQAFNGTAGQQTILRVGPNPDGKDARDVTVIPIPNESGLRLIDWVEGNRKKVDELSGGKLAYVYMFDTGGSGYNSFNRYFYAQINKKGLVLDERWNHGGFIADYIVDVLTRKPLSGAIERDGKPVHDPMGAIFGPKVMLINQNAGSGGDAMPWYFHKAGIGKLIGTRTWGGLVGIGGYPSLLDGGYVMAPRYAIYGLNGDWEVENHGVAPDIEVDQLPKDVADGHDPQLEEGVKTVLEEMKNYKYPTFTVPPYPNYHKNDGLGRN